jgi:NADH:ubiquinone oxidoreductase subunit 3 (subunit A)
MSKIFLLNFFTKTTIGICICLELLISGLVLGISYILATETSLYKCGVEPFNYARNLRDVWFYARNLRDVRFYARNLCDVRFNIVIVIFLFSLLFSFVLQLGLTAYVSYMACNKACVTPNLFYVVNTNPVIVPEILAPTVNN